MKEKKEERPIEQEAVMTTIVGGRPPGAGKPVGKIPRGIEVLVKKASIDSAFKSLLLEKRADAAKEIELVLEPSEVMMLNAVPREQLESIIAKTTIRPSQRAAFMGKVAALMIVALTASVGCKEGTKVEGIRPDREEYREHTKGIEPDRPEYKDQSKEQPTKEIIFDLRNPKMPAEDMPLVSTGINPDIPEDSKDINTVPEEPKKQENPDKDRLTRGIRPDRVR